MSNACPSKTDSPLSIICVGTGRDGTTSLAHMIQYIFDKEGRGRTAMHEWGSVDLYMEFCNYQESGNIICLENIREMLRQCPYDCIVGNGYASILPLFKEIFGDKLTLVHLRRCDKNAFITSMADNVAQFPTNHLYYADSPLATGKRITAFHYGEASKREWIATWPLAKKLGWYYDKTHSLIKTHESLFSTVIQVETESLSSDTVRKKLSQALGAKYFPPAIHLNKHFNLDSIPVGQRPWVQRFLGKLDISRLAYEDTYGIHHALSEFIAWMSFRIRSNDGKHDSSTKSNVNKILDNARSLLIDHTKQVEELAILLGKSLKPSETERLKIELHQCRAEIQRLKKTSLRRTSFIRYLFRFCFYNITKFIRKIVKAIKFYILSL